MVVTASGSRVWAKQKFPATGARLLVQLVGASPRSCHSAHLPSTLARRSLAKTPHKRWEESVGLRSQNITAIFDALTLFEPCWISRPLCTFIDIYFGQRPPKQFYRKPLVQRCNWHPKDIAMDADWDEASAHLCKQPPTFSYLHIACTSPKARAQASSTCEPDCRMDEYPGDTPTPSNSQPNYHCSGIRFAFTTAP